MPPSAEAKTKLREFAVFRANGEHFSVVARNLLEVARKHKHTPEPGAEIVAILEMKFLVRPNMSGLPMQFAALSSRRAS